MPLVTSCAACHRPLGVTLRICPACGHRVASTLPAAGHTTQTPPTLPYTQGNSLPPVVGGQAWEFQFAGIWARLGAWIIDTILVFLLVLATSTVIPVFAGIISAWLYYTLFETGGWQATPGKRLVGLKVTDINGVRLRFTRSSGRFFGRFLCTATLGIGFLRAGWTPNKQGLHDLVAGTFVLYRS